ncbi:hypothetical protein DUI87_04969 [Hirundo rustica rustica]|uniref:Uncharacterized protein n=1 Tax=Hirundo rustica rustica TaxID=333673 RepID=A0A3M0L531_HIRRU|nr:hypothetical protein DUI87_04969 [Hirundo rustica rustica]
MRLMPSRSGRSRAGESSSAGLWTLPPCQVTVRPRDHTRFWDDVKNKVKELVSCDSAHRLLEGGDEFSDLVAAAETTAILGGVEVPPSPVPVMSTEGD